jgi:indolepyruvate ferredoxin oxidoreductase
MLASIALDDKYTVEKGRVFLTGIQAMVRLPMMQRRRDEAAGLDTACYVTGYRGSPLGGVDIAFNQARAFLGRHNIVFQPGINEDLAATAAWGSQQTDLFGDNRYDGVFTLWYGKGPGVDRSGDVLRHGNLAGSAKHGGVLLLAGDDHGCKSSTTAHQTEYAFMDFGIPVLHPANVQEILDYGLYGWALSRYSGCWVAMKIVSDTADSAASVTVDPARVDIRIPEDFTMPEGGLNIRLPVSPFATAQGLEQEMLLQKYKLYAALAFARANRLNRAVIDGPNRRFGIVTCGKSYLDVMQALDDLGIDEEYAKKIGLSVYKVGMTWPLERDGVRRFAEGLEEILVVEEKRALMENQLKEQLYNWHPDVRPRVIGKFDEHGEWILPSADELTPARIARVIARRIARFHTSPHITERLAFLDRKERALADFKPPLRRVAYYCSGCPHNTSTKVPEGSRALAGIGCHIMATWMDRSTATFTQMGGEGATWIGQAPFSRTAHVFQNLGDGTYYHSGSLGIRAAVAAKVNITFKILYNDAVAMTGGQPVDGPLDVKMIVDQLHGEGLKRIAVVSDDPGKYPNLENVTVAHRDQLMALQEEFRSVPGVSAIIYDQTCAAEKRRRRKRGLMEDPAKRVFINERVCEGCGDCADTSNCLSVIPVETEFGRKRRIDQSSCNKDYSCVAGFCPSFVTVHGGALRKPKPVAALGEILPDPVLPSLREPYNILITGVGGTGVVTVGAILTMAAHLEGKGCSVMDMTGLAQKGGAVFSHVRIASQPEDIHAVRIAAGNAHLLLGCDIVVTASYDSLAKVMAGHSRAVVNDHAVPTGDFLHKPDLEFPAEKLRAVILEALGKNAADFIDAETLATALMGDSLPTNIFLLGYAYQKGLIPVSAAAIEQALELNRTAAQQNRQAFTWGRRAAFDPESVARLAAREIPAAAEIPSGLEEIIAHRRAHLTAYQNRALAERYEKWVRHIARIESERVPGRTELAVEVAKNYARLLAYKDEYEVARLYTDGEFLARLRGTFAGEMSLRFHLAPPLGAKRDPKTGHLRKAEYGSWMMGVFRLLAPLRFLRGTWLDPFGYTADRRLERDLIAEYEQWIEGALPHLTPATHRLVTALAALPTQMRGYGHIKEANVAKARARRTELQASLENAPLQAAAE